MAKSKFEKPKIFLLTRPLRDVTQLIYQITEGIDISTHTPLAGRDYVDGDVLALPCDFYSHAPCGT